MDRVEDKHLVALEKTIRELSELIEVIEGRFSYTMTDLEKLNGFDI